jgi:transcriptional regulator with XRE-family HTH domain
MDESQRWDEFGKWIVEQRQRVGLNRRQAAKKARVSEATLRDLETGRRVAVGGIKLLPNLSADVLARVAAALELPVEEVMRRVGRAPDGAADSSRPARGRPSSAPNTRASLAQKISRLSYRDRRLVEHLVDAMLEEEA